MTHYCNGENIRRQPLTLLKTEHRFISGIENDTFLREFYRMVSGISHARGIKMVAQGIETADK